MCRVLHLKKRKFWRILELFEKRSQLRSRVTLFESHFSVCYLMCLVFQKLTRNEVQTRWSHKIFVPRILFPCPSTLQIVDGNLLGHQFWTFAMFAKNSNRLRVQKCCLDTSKTTDTSIQIRQILLLVTGEFTNICPHF